MSATDILLAGAILAGSCWLLYRSLVKSGGHCHGCGGCGARTRQPESLVKLGRPPRL